jgi:EAL domain-containing protein (putative c-di-GMP-specific phosphodiesterase class I)
MARRCRDAHDALGHAARHPAGARRTASERDAGGPLDRAAARSVRARRTPGSLLIARIGATVAVTLGMAIAGVAGGVRAAALDVWTLYAAALASAFGIAIMQPGMPTLVRQWLPNRVATGTIGYSAGMLIGAMLLAVLTIGYVLPAVRGSWRLDVLVWAVPAVLMVPVFYFKNSAPAAPGGGRIGRAGWSGCSASLLPATSQVGRRLKDCVREVDLVARLSGDDFAVIVADAKDADVAKKVAYRIVGSLDNALVMDDIEISTGACVGIAFAPSDGADPELLLKSADQALYAAKHGHGGAIQLYDAGYQDATRQRRNIERDLRHALRCNGFFLVFQPIFALNDNHIAGCEALLRWKHSLGVRSPSEFVHIMEETGLINEIGQWVFLDACKAAANWPKPIRLSVNASAIQLRQANILSSVANPLAASALQPDRLEIEITETAVLDDREQILSNLTALRELGVRIALHDFGTGYSSLTYLRRLSPDSIKIDGSFVREIGTNADSTSIVKSLIALSHDLGIRVVGEGIETGEQLHFLRGHDCEEGQGYLLCKPKLPDEIEDILLIANERKIVAVSSR